ncbi:OmpH family outer membrane protein [Sphingomonas sp.]|uniref:OmpH family outer membrane protein n=1 Tax=Sphingomonas sp. TaxID=28214 RepID=UPI00286B1618|nr:OmpH family outer membrane protein [Sphingomonas sp.]
MAQSVPAATIAVVDLEKVTSQCNACKTAKAALTSQLNALKARQASLAAPLEVEGKAIQAAASALAGKAPDAALQARAQAFETKRQAAGQEISRQEQQIQRNQAYIQQQIAAKLGPIYQQVMQRRGANIMVEVSTTLATSASLDVSGDVLAALNASLPSLQTIAPAQAAPQGR